MPCISQSEWHVAPPPQPLPNSHLHMAEKVDLIKMSKYTGIGELEIDRELRICNYR